MDARGRIPSSSSGRSVQAPGMMRHGPFPGSEPSGGHRPREPPSHSELLEDKISAQAAEMERLTVENRRLATTQVGLREDLVSAHQEVQRLKAHIRSIETESDIQIRILVDKIARMEADIRVGENVKKDLRQAHIDAQNLVMDKQELTARIQHASQELQRINSDVKKLPEMHSLIDNLRKEHDRLRGIFENEKGSNVEQVHQMQLKEKNLVSMAREVERLRMEVSNAENRARAPVAYGGGYMVMDQSYQPHTQGGAPYVDGYGRPVAQMGATVGAEGMVPYGNNNPAAGSAGSTGVSTSSSGAVWGGAHHMQGAVSYVDGYGRPVPQMGVEGMAAAAVGGTAVSTPSSGGVWGGTHHMQGGVGYVDGYGRSVGQAGSVAYNNHNPEAVSGGRPPPDQMSGDAGGEGRVSHGSSNAEAGSAGGTQR